MSGLVRLLLGAALTVGARPNAGEVPQGRQECGFEVGGASPAVWFADLGAAHTGAGFVVTSTEVAARPREPSVLVARITVPGNPYAFAIAYRCERFEHGPDLDCCPELRAVREPAVHDTERRNVALRAFEAARRDAFARLATRYRTSQTATRPRYTRVP